MNFYQHVLVLAETEMQTQFCKYYGTAHLFFLLFLKILFPACSFFVFSFLIKWKISTMEKVSKYGVISGPYFPVFSPNTVKYGP